MPDNNLQDAKLFIENGMRDINSTIAIHAHKFLDLSFKSTVSHAIRAYYCHQKGPQFLPLMIFEAIFALFCLMAFAIVNIGNPDKTLLSTLGRLIWLRAQGKVELSSEGILNALTPEDFKVIGHTLNKPLAVEVVNDNLGFFQGYFKGSPAILRIINDPKSLRSAVKASAEFMLHASKNKDKTVPIVALINKVIAVQGNAQFFDKLDDILNALTPADFKAVSVFLADTQFALYFYNNRDDLMRLIRPYLGDDRSTYILDKMKNGNTTIVIEAFRALSQLSDLGSKKSQEIKQAVSVVVGGQGSYGKLIDDILSNFTKDEFKELLEVLDKNNLLTQAILTNFIAKYNDGYALMKRIKEYFEFDQQHRLNAITWYLSLSAAELNTYQNKTKDEIVTAITTYKGALKPPSNFSLVDIVDKISDKSIENFAAFFNEDLLSNLLQKHMQCLGSIDTFDGNDALLDFLDTKSKVMKPFGALIASLLPNFKGMQKSYSKFMRVRENEVDASVPKENDSRSIAEKQCALLQINMIDDVDLAEIISQADNDGATKVVRPAKESEFYEAIAKLTEIKKGASVKEFQKERTNAVIDILDIVSRLKDSNIKEIQALKVEITKFNRGQNNLEAVENELLTLVGVLSFHNLERKALERDMAKFLVRLGALAGGSTKQALQDLFANDAFTNLVHFYLPKHMQGHFKDLIKDLDARNALIEAIFIAFQSKQPDELAKIAEKIVYMLFPKSNTEVLFAELNNTKLKIAAIDDIELLEWLDALDPLVQNILNYVVDAQKDVAKLKYDFAYNIILDQLANDDTFDIDGIKTTIKRTEPKLLPAFSSATDVDAVIAERTGLNEQYNNALDAALKAKKLTIAQLEQYVSDLGLKAKYEAKFAKTYKDELTNRGVVDSVIKHIPEIFKNDKLLIGHSQMRNVIVKAVENLFIIDATKKIEERDVNAEIYPMLQQIFQTKSLQGRFNSDCANLYNKIDYAKDAEDIIDLLLIFFESRKDLAPYCQSHAKKVNEVIQAAVRLPKIANSLAKSDLDLDLLNIFEISFKSPKNSIVLLKKLSQLLRTGQWNDVVELIKSLETLMRDTIVADELKTFLADEKYRYMLARIIIRALSVHSPNKYKQLLSNGVTIKSLVDTLAGNAAAISKTQGKLHSLFNTSSSFAKSRLPSAYAEMIGDKLSQVGDVSELVSASLIKNLVSQFVSSKFSTEQSIELSENTINGLIDLFTLKPQLEALETKRRRLERREVVRQKHIEVAKISDAKKSKIVDQITEIVKEREALAKQISIVKNMINLIKMSAEPLIVEMMEFGVYPDQYISYDKDAGKMALNTITSEQAQISLDKYTLNTLEMNMVSFAAFSLSNSNIEEASQSGDIKDFVIDASTIKKLEVHNVRTLEFNSVTAHSVDLLSAELAHLIIRDSVVYELVVANFANLSLNNIEIKNSTITLSVLAKLLEYTKARAEDHPDEILKLDGIKIICANDKEMLDMKMMLAAHPEVQATNIRVQNNGKETLFDNLSNTNKELNLNDMRLESVTVKDDVNKLIVSDSKFQTLAVNIDQHAENRVLEITKTLVSEFTQSGALASVRAKSAHLENVTLNNIHTLELDEVAINNLNISSPNIARIEAKNSTILNLEIDTSCDLSLDLIKLENSTISFQAFKKLMEYAQARTQTHSDEILSLRDLTIECLNAQEQSEVKTLLDIRAEIDASNITMKLPSGALTKIDRVVRNIDQLRLQNIKLKSVVIGDFVKNVNIDHAIVSHIDIVLNASTEPRMIEISNSKISYQAFQSIIDSITDRNVAASTGTMNYIKRMAGIKANDPDRLKLSNVGIDLTGLGQDDALRFVSSVIQAHDTKLENITFVNPQTKFIRQFIQKSHPEVTGYKVQDNFRVI